MNNWITHCEVKGSIPLESIKRLKSEHLLLCQWICCDRLVLVMRKAMRRNKILIAFCNLVFHIQRVFHFSNFP